MRTLMGLMAGLVAVALAVPTLAAERHPPSRRGSEPVEDVGAETATHKEAEPLDVAFSNITALRMTAKGNLLAADSTEKTIKIIDPKGKHFASVTLPFGPEALDVAPDGTLYCGGQGKLAKLDGKGKVVRTVDLPTGDSPSAQPPRRGRSRTPRVSGIAVTEQDVFVAIGAGWSLGSKSKLYRLDRDLGSPKQLAEGLRGCCQRCDIVVHKGDLYLAENAVHRVVRYDREGKALGKWGERSRTGLEGFGSCCNPMNLCVGGDGSLYTAESGTARVKRYTLDGKFLGLVGYVGTTRFSRAGGLAASCSNIAIAVTAGGDRVYVMDYPNKKIRVLEKKG